MGHLGKSFVIGHVDNELFAGEVWTRDSLLMDIGQESLSGGICGPVIL